MNRFGDDGWSHVSGSDPAPLQASLVLLTVAVVFVVLTSFLTPL